MSWRRTLTGLERWCWLIDRAAAFNLVVVARVRGRLDEARLRLALGLVQSHYPHLGARIEGDDKPEFVAVDTAPAIDCRAWQPGAWRRVAIEQADTPVPVDNGPPVRCVWLRGPECADLVLAFHRAAADARSGVLIIDEVLRYHGGEARPALPAPEVLEPPLEQMLGSRWAAIITSGKQVRISRRLRMMRKHPSVPAKHRTTGLMAATLESTAVEALTARARAHGATVHGALCAAVLQAVREEMRRHEGAPEVLLGCESAVDMRPHADLRPGAIGNLASRAPTGHRIHEHTLFWDLAADVSESVRSVVRSGDVKAFAQARSSAGRRARNARRLAARMERAGRSAAMVTNVGRLDFYERYGDLRLERLSLLETAAPPAAGALSLHAATVAGTMTLSFTWAEPLIGAERGGRIAADARARLTEAAGA